MAKAGVVAFAFGIGDLPSNARISSIATKKAKETGGIVYTQRDLYISRKISFLPVLDGGFPKSYWIDVKYIPGEQPSKPPSTLRLARWAVRQAISDGVY